MPNEKILFHATLCFILGSGHVLLPVKLKKIGAGKRNGYGGGIEPGESSLQSVVRETFEESGGKLPNRHENWGIVLNPLQLKKVAIITFHNINAKAESFDCVVDVYTCSDFSGEPVATDEMGPPEWFPTNSVPYSELMSADSIWLKDVLLGKKLTQEFWYGPRQEKLLRSGPPRYLESID